MSNLPLAGVRARERHGDLIEACDLHFGSLPAQEDPLRLLNFTFDIHIVTSLRNWVLSPLEAAVLLLQPAISLQLRQQKRLRHQQCPR